MSRSQNHHFVPKTILKHFCVEGSSVYYATKRKTPFTIEVRNINSVFKRRHYNTVTRTDGSKSDGLERFFAVELDNYVPNWMDIFQKCLVSGNVSFKSGEDRRRFIQFFYNLSKRTPDFIEPIAKEAIQEVFSQENLRKLEEHTRPFTPEERAKFNSPDYQHTVASRSRIENFSRQSIHILETLDSMSLVVATPASPRKSFVVGSNPKIRFEDYPFQELGSEGVELWTPMSPKIAIGFTARQDSTSLLRLDDKSVRKINMQLAKQSNAIASHSDRLLRSIIAACW